MRASVLVRALRALAAVVIVGLLVRALVAVPRRVPSESMVPTLMVGDVFVALRWPYGSALARRLGGGMPRRGDVVVFHAPGGGDVVKRVIGLPGDRVAVRAGAVLLNDRPLPRFRVADLLVPQTSDHPCARSVSARDPATCLIPRWRELLPDGSGYDTLDLGTTAADTMPQRRVPAGRLFLLGDNRDRSADSRLSVAEGGVGFVPIADVVGRAAVILWSTDGGKSDRSLRGWWRGLRTDRTGLAIALRPALPASTAPDPPLGRAR